MSSRTRNSRRNQHSQSTSSSPSKDYYGILGINKDATEQEIKSTYRKLALKLHPDRTKGDAQLDEQFKNVQEAYDVLSDPERKRLYDDHGVCDGEEQEFKQQQQFASHPFAHMFGGDGGGREREHTNTMVPEEKHVFDISLSEIFTGCEKIVKFTIDAKCELCDGSGAQTKSRLKCDECRGVGMKMGYVQIGPGMMAQQQMACDKCHTLGTYVKANDKCPACASKGTIKRDIEKNITISPAHDHEHVFKMLNAGSYDIKSGKKADVLICTRISDLETFGLEMEKGKTHDLRTHMKINVRDALMGREFYFHNYPDRKNYVFESVSPIRDGEVRFVDLGLPNSSGPRGKLYVEFEYEYPSELLETEEEYYEFVGTKGKARNDELEYVKIRLYNKNTFEEKTNELEDKNEHRHMFGHGPFGSEEHPIGPCTQS